MFAKILHGQFGLKDMFWKYGVLTIAFLCFIISIFRAFLIEKLKGMTLIYYYRHVFSFVQMDNSMFFLTVLYFAFLAFLLFYGTILIFGVFRSSAEYDKSVWLRHIARILTIVMVFLAVKVVL